jgi:hypothetical protein
MTRCDRQLHLCLLIYALLLAALRRCWRVPNSIIENKNCPPAVAAATVKPAVRMYCTPSSVSPRPRNNLPIMCAPGSAAESAGLVSLFFLANFGGIDGGKTSGSIPHAKRRGQVFS